jgi:DNA-binding transcriptional MerR regulator
MVKKKGLKISELSKRTGVPKSTILYYVKKGLLPEPVKTSPNMAWYDESCIDRLTIIKELQNRKFIPLDHIKALIEEREKDDVHTQMLIDSHRMLFDYKMPGESSYTRNQMKRLTGLTEEEISTAEKFLLIVPASELPHPYDDEDVKQGKILKRMVKYGLELEQLKYYPELINEMVYQDLLLHDEVTEESIHRNDLEFLKITETLVNSARQARYYLFDRLFQKSLIEHMKDVINDEFKGKNLIEKKFFKHKKRSENED